MLTIKSFVFSPVHENTYVFYNEKGNAIIIDPGCYFTQEQKTLHSFILDNKLTVVQLINTHCHLDHVFGNKWASVTFGLELYIHADEEKVLAFAPQSGLKWGLPVDNYKGKLNFLAEGDTVTIDDDKLSVLLTPGHSPGSISFYCKEQNFVISGDVLFKNSIGRTDLPGGDFNTLINSIRTKLFVLPDETIVYNGHGSPTTIGSEKLHNPFLQP